MKKDKERLRMKPSERIYQIIEEFQCQKAATSPETYAGYCLEAIIKYLDEEMIGQRIIAAEADLIECKEYIQEEAHDKYSSPDTWAKDKK